MTCIGPHKFVRFVRVVVHCSTPPPFLSVLLLGCVHRSTCPVPSRGLAGQSLVSSSSYLCCGMYSLCMMNTPCKLPWISLVICRRQSAEHSVGLPSGPFLFLNFRLAMSLFLFPDYFLLLTVSHSGDAARVCHAGHRVARMDLTRPL